MLDITRLKCFLTHKLKLTSSFTKNGAELWNTMITMQKYRKACKCTLMRFFMYVEEGKRLKIYILVFSHRKNQNQMIIHQYAPLHQLESADLPKY